MAHGFARLLGLGVFAGLTDQCAQLLHIGGGAGVDPLAQRVVIGDQAVAPLFGGVQRHGLQGRRGVLLHQRGPDGVVCCRLQLAHALADELHQPAAPFKVGDALVFRNRFEQLVGQFQAVQQFRTQSQKVFTQLLQLGAFALEIGATFLVGSLELALELQVQFTAFRHEFALDEIAFF